MNVRVALSSSRGDIVQKLLMTGRTTVAVTLACVLAGALTTAATPKSYGKGVAIADATPLTDVLASPTKYEGKRVRVEGYVTSVCEEMGCWLALAPAPGAAEPSLLIQVEHGVVVFPMSARGARAAAEGVVERIGGGQGHHAAAGHGGHGDHGDHGKEAAAEHAKAQGKSPADAAQWHLMATGALIYN